MRLQDGGGGAVAVTNHGGEHDGTVNFPAAALAGGSGGIVEDPHQRFVGGGIDDVVLGEPVIIAADLGGNISAKQAEIDIGDAQYGRRVGVISEGEQQVFQRHVAVRLLASIIAGARHRCSKVARHRHPAQRGGKLRHETVLLRF